MSLPEEKVIWDAEFNDAVTTYWLLNGILLCIVTVVGIVFLPFWIIGGKFVTRKYLASHRCTLTDRSLKVGKGILTKIEKTVPLDRITDVAILEGPIMRYFGIEALSVETAGQSSVGSLISLAGIKEGRKFRDAVLEQREKLVGSSEKASTATSDSGGLGDESIGLLTEIRDTLKRIEEGQRGA